MVSRKKVLKYRTEYRNKNGQLHRIGGPAIIWTDCSYTWMVEGKYHREDGPAIKRADGTVYWYLNDKDYSEQEYDEEILKIRLQRLMEL